MDELLQEAYQLKKSIDQYTDRLHEINRQIAETADFSGKKSTTINGQYVRAKVALRENIKWDQEKLQQIKGFFPEKFGMFFKTEYKPISSRAVETASPELRRAIEWSRAVSPGAPSVTYELIEEDLENAA